MSVVPLSPAELLELAAHSATTNLPTTGRAFGISEPVIRELARCGELEERVGVRVLRLGAQYRVPVADILRVLGIARDTETAGSAPTDPAGQTTIPAKGRHDHHTFAV